MTVDVPFPDRPPTPSWKRGGMGDYTLSTGQPCDPGLVGPVLCQDTTQRVLAAIAAGAGAASSAITGPSSYVSCPVGTVYNPMTLTCQPGVAVQAQASGSGLILLLIVGAVIVYLARR